MHPTKREQTQWRSWQLKSTRFSTPSILSWSAWRIIPDFPSRTPESEWGVKKRGCGNRVSPRTDTKTTQHDFCIHLQRNTRGVWYHTAIIFHRDWRHVCWEHNKGSIFAIIDQGWWGSGDAGRLFVSTGTFGVIWTIHLKHALFNHTYVRTSQHICNPDQNMNQSMSLSNIQR